MIFRWPEANLANATSRAELEEWLAARGIPLLVATDVEDAFLPRLRNGQDGDGYGYGYGYGYGSGDGYGYGSGYGGER